jgi:hypothetical protein
LDAAKAAIKAKRVESAAQFIARAYAYRAAQYSPPVRLQEHLKGLIVLKPDWPKRTEEFLETVHADSVSVGEPQDGVLRLKIVGEVFGPPAFLAERLVGCSKVVMEIGDCLGGSGVKEFKDLFGDREVTTFVTGFACSAGAYLSQLGSNRVITPNGAILLHPRVSVVVGNFFYLRKVIESLEASHQIDVEFLCHRTGQPRVVVEAWLSGDDVVFDAHQAMAAGLVDEISAVGSSFPGLAPGSNSTGAAEQGGRIERADD